MFKLLQLNIREDHFFKNIDLSFVNKGEEDNGPYITLIIGPNGTGKSLLLAKIVEIFNFLAALRTSPNKKSRFSYEFDLSYKIDNCIIRVLNNVETTTCYKNEQIIEYTQLPIPTKILASSFSLTDRFPNLKPRNLNYNENYEYLGIRSASNNAFVNSDLKSLINHLINSLKSEANYDKFELLFNHLKLKPQIEVIYEQSKNFRASRKQSLPDYLTTYEKVYAYFDDYINRYEKQGVINFRHQTYKKVITDQERVTKAIDFLHRNEFLFSRYSPVIDSLSYTINFQEKKIIQNRTNLIFSDEDFEALRTLQDLEILRPYKIILNNYSSNYPFEQSSTGEYQLLSTFIKILSTIDNNSLIVIDEPEISLHPNWQMQYVDLLYKIFGSYTSSHFMLATHSHFLVSDLKAYNSSILSLYKNNKENTINSVLYDYDTEGWSPENILYKVFGVSTVRNYYMEIELREVLHMISKKSRDFDKMKEILERLSRFKLSESDPLNEIIKRINIYLSQNVD